MAQSWIMLCAVPSSGTISSEERDPSAAKVVMRAPGLPALGYVTPILSPVPASTFMCAVSAPPAKGCRARSFSCPSKSKPAAMVVTVPSVSTRSSAGKHCSIRARTRPPFPRGSSPVFACRGSEARTFRKRSVPPPPRGVSGALSVLLRLRSAQPVHEQAPQQRQPSRRDERAVKETPLRFPLLDEPLRPHPGARVGRLALDRQDDAVEHAVAVEPAALFACVLRLWVRAIL
mmetsp:Transcript_30014/g.100331  ORF Transcript_30014/g.100331 Transcript_30014/m.100331 type:complete len:232 (-) Transcript_30014:260-955(-)